MWIDDLVVEPGREDHIADHGVSIDEVYEVAFGIYIVDRSREGRYRLIGQTASGRYLSIILAPRGGNVYALVTARDATDAERRLYHRRRGI